MTTSSNPPDPPQSSDRYVLLPREARLQKPDFLRPNPPPPSGSSSSRAVTGLTLGLRSAFRFAARTATRSVKAIVSNWQTSSISFATGFVVKTAFAHAAAAATVPIATACLTTLGIASSSILIPIAAAAMAGAVTGAVTGAITKLLVTKYKHVRNKDIHKQPLAKNWVWNALWKGAVTGAACGALGGIVGGISHHFYATHHAATSAPHSGISDAGSASPPATQPNVTPNSTSLDPTPSEPDVKYLTKFIDQDFDGLPPTLKAQAHYALDHKDWKDLAARFMDAGYIKRIRITHHYTAGIVKDWQVAGELIDYQNATGPHVTGHIAKIASDGIGFFNRNPQLALRAN